MICWKKKKNENETTKPGTSGKPVPAKSSGKQ
jgi:hypothetical protein